MKAKSRLAIGIMVAVVLVFSSSVFMYKSLIDVVKETESATTDQIKEEQFKSIWLYLRSLQVQSEREVARVSSNVEEALKELPNETLEQIQTDMDNNRYNYNLHEILDSNTSSQSLNGVRNHKNGIVVMSEEGIIQDYNYRRAIKNNPEENVMDTFRSWDEDLENSYNKELSRDAIDKLMNRTAGIIAFENYDLIENEDHIKIDEMTYRNLLKVYLTEGMAGLRNYQIFVPYYITDMGDIFGEPDIVQGVKNDNNKIIIAQEFNLYDQIIANQTDIFDETLIKDISAHYNETMRLLYVFGIASITGICALIFYFCTLYNAMVIRSRIEDGEIDIEDKEEKQELDTK